MSSRNIQEFLIRCKASLEDGVGDWGLYIVVFLVAFSAFGLGRLSALEAAQAPVSIQIAPTLATPQGMYPGGQYVASRTGTVYYYPWCTAGQNIANNAVFHPQTLSMGLTHFAPWPREDTFGIICFAVSLISFFVWNLVRDSR